MINYYDNPWTNENYCLSLRGCLPIGISDMATYNIVLADDHILVRQGIKKILQEDHEMRVVGEAADGVELLEILEKITPEMVMLKGSTIPKS